MNGNQLNRTPLGIDGNCAVYRPAGLQRLPRRIAATAIVVLMIGALSPAAQAMDADDSSAEGRAGVGAITADLLVLRPAGVVMSLFGVVLFIPAAILSLPTGWDNVMDGYELLIREPFHETFQRPLGRP